MECKNLSEDSSSMNITLKKVDIFGNVCGEFVEFTVTQEYLNEGSDDVKGVYTFLIPDKAVISGFEINAGGRVVKGKVEDKREIEKLYSNLEGAVDNKVELEKLTGDEMKIGIGSILKGETVTIKISYVEELSYEDSKLKLEIPKVMIPGENVPIDKSLGYDIYLNLLVETFEDTKFSCSTHNIKVEEGENNLYKITLADDNRKLEDNMVIYLDEDIEEADGIVYENYKEDKGIIYLRFLPDIDIDIEDSERKESYIFLIDISDSMEGKKLKEAKTALQLCLRNLNERDTFNIVAMGINLNMFSETGNVGFSDETLKSASKWINSLKCEEDAAIFEGIKYAFSQEQCGIQNNVILFTDDVADNEVEILDYVEENCGESRIFPFGINTSVNTYFINKLARITYGKAEFINEELRIEDVVLRQFNRIKGMQLTDISLDFGRMEVEKTYPRTIDYLYDEEPFSIFARVNGDFEGVVTLTGSAEGRRIQRKIALTKLDLSENANLVEKVWFKKRIEAIENRIVYERGEVKEAMREKMIQLSCESGIVSDETSFMLIEEIYEPVLGIVVRNFLPVTNEDCSYDDSIKEDLDKASEETGDKEEFLRLIAIHQLAGGSFECEDDEDIYDRVLTTAKCMIVFLKSAKDISIYRAMIAKAAEFIIKNYEDVWDDLESVGTIYFALTLYKSRISVKESRKREFEEVVSKLLLILEEQNSDIDDIESKVISDIEEDSTKNHLNRLIYNAIR